MHIYVVQPLYSIHRSRVVTKEQMEKRDPEKNTNSRFQLQLEKDGGSSARQSWMETSGQWPICTESERLTTYKSTHAIFKALIAADCIISINSYNQDLHLSGKFYTTSPIISSSILISGIALIDIVQPLIYNT